jgi:hypothetical protein
MSYVRGDLWRNDFTRQSLLPVMSVPLAVQWFKMQSQQKFSGWYEASYEHVIRGFLQVLRLPPLL